MSDEVEVTTEEAAAEKKSIARKVTGISKEATLVVKVEANPKRPGSSAYDRFDGYFKEGVDTVQKALDAGLTMGDIKYDSIHGFIEVEGAEITEYEVSARGPRAKKAGSVGDDLLESGDSVGLLSNEEDDVL